jgi:hypothetical protein
LKGFYAVVDADAKADAKARADRKEVKNEDGKSEITDTSFNQDLKQLDIVAAQAQEGTGKQITQITHRMLSKVYDKCKSEMKKDDVLNSTFAKKMVYILRKIVKVQISDDLMLSDEDKKILNVIFKNYVDKLSNYLKSN